MSCLRHRQILLQQPHTLLRQVSCQHLPKHDCQPAVQVLPTELEHCYSTRQARQSSSTESGAPASSLWSRPCACPAQVAYCPDSAVLQSPCLHDKLTMTGSTELHHCLCPLGCGIVVGPAHMTEELSNPCPLYVHCFFAPDCSRSVFTACQSMQNTSAPSVISLTNCTCVPGHCVLAEHNLADPCSQFADGFFTIGGLNMPCMHCDWGAITKLSNIASTVSNCQCNMLLGLYKSHV